MSTYNGEKYLRESIESVLNQTFSDFEFLIIDDASTDSSQDIINNYNDPRIILIENKDNIGQAESLNRGLREAKGDYIGRMDQDDLSLPQRVEKQVHFLDEHPEIGVCGTFISFIDDNNLHRYHSYLRDPMIGSNELKAQLLFSPCFIHPTVMIRTSLLRKYDLAYNKNFEPAEDYWMWHELSSVTEFCNIPEKLLKLREHNRQRSIIDKRKQISGADIIRKQTLKSFVNDKLTENFESRFMMISRFEHLNELSDLRDAEECLSSLLEINQTKCRYDQNALKMVLSLVWYYLCMNSTHLGLRILKKYYLSPLFCIKGNFYQHLKFLVKCILKFKVRLPQLSI
tara:strand:- start:896 stop:1921 length:1026 start_codon:yes stop_codon:yes gene_type:complete